MRSISPLKVFLSGRASDDLDTLRRRPQNIDLGALPAARPSYLTFSEYRELPAWLSAFDLQGVCSVRDLAHAGHRTPIDLSGFDHLFIESPGLDAGELVPPQTA